MTYRFSIIIPTYNRARLLEKALASVQQLRVPAGCEAEVLVIDNNCTDDTAEVAGRSNREGPFAVRHIVEERQGLNHGRNRGLKEAAYEHLVYLDDDMTVVPEWLEGYAEAQRAFGSAATVGPVEPVFEAPPPSWMTTRMLESVTSSYSKKGKETILVPAELAHELPGCNFAVRSDAIAEVGGFHTVLGRCGKQMLAGEDWELGHRLVRAGKTVAYSPHCRINHLISAPKMSRQGLRDRWAGLGATEAALMKLRGERLTLRRKVRLSIRLGIYLARSWRSPTESAAFQWKLEAIRLRSRLYGLPG